MRTERSPADHLRSFNFSRLNGTIFGRWCLVTMRSVFLLLGLLLVQLPQDSASIEGYVVSSGTATPIVRARVELLAEGAGGSPHTAISDGGGRFVFQNLQPGRYRISALRNGYIPAQYGQRRRGAQGAIITL